MPCGGEISSRTNADQLGFIFGKMFYPYSDSQALTLPIPRALSTLPPCSVKGRGSTVKGVWSAIQQYALPAQNVCGFSDLYLSRVCIKTDSHQALLQNRGISLLWENSISRNAEAFASSVMNKNTLGKQCGLFGFFSPGILCRQLRISPHQPGAVCQTIPHHTRERKLN